MAVNLTVENLHALLNSPEPPVKQIIGSGVLLEGTKAVLYGVFKGGKTTLLEYIALSLAGGYPLFGDKKRFSTVQSKVLYIQCELPRLAFKEKLKECSLAHDPTVQANFDTTTTFWLKLDTDEACDLLEQELKKCQPQVVIIDPLYKVLSGSENSTQDIGRLTDNLDLLIEKYNFSLIVSAQARKNLIVPKTGAPMDLGDQELRGSTGIPAWVDTIVGLRQNAGTKRNLNFTLRHGKTDRLNVTVSLDTGTKLYSVL
jgi:hypothetical protein